MITRPVSRTRRVLTAAAVLLVPTALVACGSEKGGADGEYCTLIRAYETDSNNFGDIFNDPAATPESLKEGIDELVAAIDTLHDAAPDELKADVDAVRGTITMVSDVLEKYDYDFMALATAPEAVELQARFESDEVVSAGERLDTYTTETCGVSGE
jgi:hypothetical protein